MSRKRTVAWAHSSLETSRVALGKGPRSRCSRSLSHSKKPPSHTRSTPASMGKQLGLFVSNTTTSLSQELGSETLGAELDTDHLPESPQQKTGMNTQDESVDRVQEVTHVLGLAQPTIKSGVEGLIPRSRCSPLERTRVCTGDRWAAEGAGSMCEFRAWS